MCGLFGFVGNHYPNIPKVKILGIYNESRGKDSSGYYYQGIIKKDSSFQKKEFKDFLQHYVIKTDENYGCSVFMGHTRAGTKGAATDLNAHPHESENFIIVHNGTIDNINELCDKYELDHTGIFNDSKLLGMLIDKVGFQILSEYIGYAAIMAYDKREPNTIYAYHGASNNYVNDLKPTEERPLFFIYSKEEKGYYFSSLETSLKAIKEDEEDVVKTLEHNVVFKIKGDNIIDKININRVHNNEALKKNYYQSSQTKSGDNTTKNVMVPIKNAMASANNLDISSETLHRRYYEINSEEEFMVSYKLRYFTTHNEKPCEGKILINKAGKIYNKEKDSLIDFIPYYFFKGILLKGEKEYKELVSIIQEKSIGYSFLLNPSQYHFSLFISRFAFYPVCNIENEGVYAMNTPSTAKKLWFRSNQNANGAFSPKFCDREYIFKDGYLIDIRNKNNYEEEFLIDTVRSIFKHYNKKYQTNESDDNKIKISLYRNFFKRIWKSKEEIEDNCPVTVLIALRNYFTNVYKDSNTIPTENDLDNQLDYFYTICIEDKISFEDNIELTYFSKINDFIKLAMFELDELEKKN